MFRQREVKVVSDGQENVALGDWFCPDCDSYLDARRVTNDEHCDDCGAEVIWLDAEGRDENGYTRREIVDNR